MTPETESQPTARLFTYRVTWCRIGERDTFNHLVTAGRVEDARRASRAELRLALGPNLSLWELESVTCLGAPFASTQSAACSASGSPR